MKTKITIAFALLFMSFSVTAQIDRSKQPQPGPAPKIALEVPGEFELKNGMKVLVVENHKLPRVSFSLRLDNTPLYEGKHAGMADIFGAMMGNGTTNIAKDTFNEEIDFLGANVNFSFNGGSASGLSKYTTRILELMADATINPLFTETEFQKEKDKLLENLKSQEKNVEAVAGRVAGVLAYGKHHPYGEYVTEETINNINLNNINALYQQRFNPSRAYLVVIGDVKFDDIKKQIKKYFGKWKKSVDVSQPVPKPNVNASHTQINFVDMPNAVQSNISVTSTVDLKMNNPDFFPVLIANKILGGGFNSYLNMNLREAHGYTYGARSSVPSDKYIARFRAGAKVRNAVTDSAVVETLKEIKRIKTELVTPEALANAKAKYVGDFVLALERPTTVARYALNIKLNDLPQDFYTTFLEKINAVTAEDVKRVANKYFTNDNARIVVVGKGKEVIENLKKTYIPMYYFDKYGNKVDEPNYDAEMPNDVTVASVLDNYIKAVGGKAKAEGIKSVVQNMSASFQGQQMTSTVKYMAPNMYSNEVNAMGMTVFKQAFNGTSGYMSQMGTKKDMDEKMINSMKAKTAYFTELNLLKSDNKVTLEGVETIDGNKAYAVKVVTPEGESSTTYYDTTSGLKVQESKTVKVPSTGQEITQNTSFGDYKAVDGIMFPHKITVPMGPQKIELNVTDIKVNSSLTAEDFN